jgi:hypothetical protein
MTALPSKSTPKRWRLHDAAFNDYQYVIADGPEIVGEVEVMPVSEHENAITVKRQAFEVAEGGRKVWMERAEQAQAENERLREALRRVRGAKLVTPGAGWVGESPFLIASAALDRLPLSRRTGSQEHSSTGKEEHR